MESKLQGKSEALEEVVAGPGRSRDGYAPGSGTSGDSDVEGSRNH